MIACTAFVLAFALLPAQRPEAEAQSPAPVEVKLGGNEKQRYFLHAPKDAKARASGRKLPVVMPGGDGSADFAPFVGRIRENALGDDGLVEQMVAPVCIKDQAEKLVWPTKLSPWPKMEFPCEEFFDAVYADVAKTKQLDSKCVHARVVVERHALIHARPAREDERDGHLRGDVRFPSRVAAEARQRQGPRVPRAHPLGRPTPAGARPAGASGGSARAGAQRKRQTGQANTAAAASRSSARVRAETTEGADSTGAGPAAFPPLPSATSRARKAVLHFADHANRPRRGSIDGRPRAVLEQISLRLAREDGRSQRMTTGSGHCGRRPAGSGRPTEKAAVPGRSGPLSRVL